MDPVNDAPAVFAPSSEAVRVNDYDSFAEDYAAQDESGVQNAYYEWPALA